MKMFSVPQSMCSTDGAGFNLCKSDSLLTAFYQITTKNDEKISGKIVMADVGCQHDGLLETSFDDDEMSGLSLSHVLPHRGQSRPQQDFQCQVNRDTEIQTSHIIDVDDFIEKKDSGVDPVFDDKTSILELEEKIRYRKNEVLEIFYVLHIFTFYRSLIAALAVSERKNVDQAAESEKNLMELRENLQFADKRLDRKLRQLEKLNSALTLSRAEAEDWRAVGTEYQQLSTEHQREIQSLVALLGLCYSTNLRIYN